MWILGAITLFLIICYATANQGKQDANRCFDVGGVVKEEKIMEKYILTNMDGGRREVYLEAPKQGASHNLYFRIEPSDSTWNLNWRNVITILDMHTNKEYYIKLINECFGMTFVFVEDFDGILLELGVTREDVSSAMVTCGVSKDRCYYALYERCKKQRQEQQGHMAELQRRAAKEQDEKFWNEINKNK